MCAEPKGCPCVFLHSFPRTQFAGCSLHTCRPVASDNSTALWSPHRSTLIWPGTHSVLCFPLATRMSQLPHEAEGGLASSMHDALSCQSRESSPSPASTWEKAPLSLDVPCLSSSCPQNDKKWKSMKEFMFEDLVAQMVGAQAICFWVTFLGFQACGKELGLIWGKQVFSGSWRGDCCYLMVQKESFVPIGKWQAKLPRGASALEP